MCERRNDPGPSCSISDQDFGADEMGKPEHGVMPAYGIDQARGPLPPHAH